MSRLGRAVLLLLAACAQVPPPDHGDASVTWSGVVFAPGGSPSGGARIEVVRERRGEPIVVATARAGPDGAFAVRLPAGGPATLSAVCPGVGAGRVEDLDGGQDLSRIEVGTMPADTVRGVVLDEAGGPVPGALVTATWGYEEGRFTLRRVRDRDPSLRVLARKRGLLGYVDVTGVTGEVVVRLAPRGSLEGRVVDEEGRPVAGASVSSQGPRAREGSDHTRWTRAWTRRDGTFLIEDLDEGADYRVAASHPDFESTEITARLPHANLPPIVLRRSTFATGRVVDENGQPIVGASIRGESKSDDEGRFRVEVDRDGRVRGEISARGYRSMMLDHGVRQEDGSHLFVLEPGRRIEGTVLDLEGRPFPTARVSAQQAGGFGWASWATSDIAGRFVLDGLEEGEYEISVYAEDRLFDPDVSATAGARDVVVREIPGVAVAGRVVDKAGRGVRVIVVAVPKESEIAEHLAVGHRARYVDGARSAWSDDDGRFRIDKLLGDEFVLHVDQEALFCDHVALPVPGVPAGAADARIVVERARRITGRLVGPDGSPRADLHVIARPTLEGLPMRDDYTNDDGRFELPGLYPTAYSLAVETRGGEERANPREVAAGTEGVEIVVEE